MTNCMVETTTEFSVGEMKPSHIFHVTPCEPVADTKLNLRKVTFFMISLELDGPYSIIHDIIAHISNSLCQMFVCLKPACR